MNNKINGNFYSIICISSVHAVDSNSYCGEHCSFCYNSNNPYNNFNFYIIESFCATCRKPYVSLDGDCVLEESLPSSIIQNDCDIYDYNLKCIKCKNYDKEDNAYSSAFLEECYNSIKEEEDKKKKKIGKYFYLYVAPNVGGIFLIGGVIFIVLYCKKRKRLQMNKEKPKEEIVQKGESQHLKEEQYKCS